MKGGFTLIETLVVIGITAILSAMLIVYSGGATPQVTLYTETSQLVGALQRAKTLALDKYNPAPGSTSSCAFGVHFTTSTNSYFIYGKLPQTTCSALSSYGFSSGDQVVQTFTMNRQIQFVMAPSDIYFVPPYFIDNSLNPPVTLGVKGTAQQSTIIVTPGSIQQTK